MWGHGNSRIQYGRQIQNGRHTQVILPRLLCTLNGKHAIEIYDWWVYGKQPTHSNAYNNPTWPPNSIWPGFPQNWHFYISFALIFFLQRIQQTCIAHKRGTMTIHEFINWTNSSIGDWRLVHTWKYMPPYQGFFRWNFRIWINCRCCAGTYFISVTSWNDKDKKVTLPHEEKHTTDTLLT